MRIVAALALALAIAVSAGPNAAGAARASAEWQAAPGNAEARLFATVDPVIDALWNGYDAKAALEHVQFISRFWRLPGNSGFDASLDRVRDRLAAAGGLEISFAETAPARTWEHTIGTLAIVHAGQPDEIILSREKERLALCINSFSTPEGGTTSRLVDVGRGDRDEDYTGKNLKGAVVLGDADAGQLWRRAVVTHGAAGVISAALPAYLNADPPGARPTPRDRWDILQWSSVPYDEARKGFGFKASPRAAARLRAALKDGANVSVHVAIASTFPVKPVRTLIAEIPGTTVPDERVVLAAHVQEPGANDNASGVATLAEMAVAISRAIARRQAPAPARTLTFLFLNEISGSRQWLQAHPVEAKQVKYMFSLDMTGEDVARTGGNFLIERYPDPGAVWDRPWDPHSEWGRGSVRADELKGDLINDLHLSVCRRVARKTGWIVKTNPYEGGSDHTVFGQAGVPSLLNWHFTDRYYHTNFDTPDKTSAEEMRNVGVAAGASAWLLASANEATATNVAELVADAGRARVAREETEGGKIAASAPDVSAARAQEATIVAAWKKWYAEAVRSAARLAVGAVSADFTATVERLAKQFERAAPEPQPIAAPSRLALSVVSASRLSLPQRPAAMDKTLLVCGEDQKYPAALEVRWDVVVRAGDTRGFAPCGGSHDITHRENRERAVIAAALRSREPEMRRLAVLMMGRMDPPFSVAFLGDRIVDPGTGTTTINMRPESDELQAGPLLQTLFRDSVPAVRRAAAYAIGDVFAAASGEFPRTEPHPKVVRLTRLAVQQRIADEADSAVVATLLETIARFPHADDGERQDVEVFLTTETRGDSTRTLGAVKGLELLIRRNPRRPIGDETRARLKELAFAGSTMGAVPTRSGADSAPVPGDADNYARIRRLALLALQAARDDDATLLAQAAVDVDWQVRRLVALRLDLGRSEHAAIANGLARDPEPQVRYDLLAAVGRDAARTHDCSGLLRSFDDPSTTVVLRAIDLVPAGCADFDEAGRRLTGWAESLRLSETYLRWHAPAHALVTLARVNPDAARPLIAGAVVHPAWQVRAAAAAAAAHLKDEGTLRKLASGDAVPNVRTAALEGLKRIGSGALAEAAIEALKSSDFELLRTGATVLSGIAGSSREAVSQPLLDALQRLTDLAWDTSRDPRVAILERLQEVLAPERASELLPYLADFDPRIREMAGKAVNALMKAPVPPAASAKYRYPYYPAAATMRTLPTRAIIEMEDGPIEIELFVDQAPVTIGRFAELARQGYYTGLTFHRVVPNFVIQGGSPGASEYSGAPRFMRDETGLQPHVRGAVGISTRGRDTGDAQLFIDLVDLPRLDHDYTVFGRVVTGYGVLDGILEGARIKSISVK